MGSNDANFFHSWHTPSVIQKRHTFILAELFHLYHIFGDKQELNQCEFLLSNFNSTH